MQTFIAAVTTSVFANNHEWIAQASDMQSSQLIKGTDMDTNRAQGPSGHTYTLKPHIVYDFDKQANRIWLNIIDAQSGKILWKIPPQAVRDLLDSLSSSNVSSFNKKL